MGKTAVRPTVIRLLVGLMMCILFPAALYGETSVRIAGSGAGLSGLKPVAAAFEKSHPGIKIEIIPRLGSSGAIKALMDGAVDLVVSSRPLRDNERTAAVAAVEYARTPFVFVGNRDVAVHSLTTRELENIFSGRVQTWPDGARLRLVFHLEGDTEAKIVKGISPGMAQAADIAQSRRGLLFAASSDESDDLVGKTPGAFGVSTLAQIVVYDLPLKVFTFNGVRPSVENLANGSYQLFKPLYMVTTQATPPAARQFAAFARSPEGRRILAKTGTLAVAAKGGSRR